MSSSKRKHNNQVESSDSSLSDLEEPVEKKSSNSKTSKPTTKASGGDELIDLSGRKYACVREFKGRIFVDIREYYEDKSSGDMKPGRKGISLNVEQWEYLKSSMDEIDREIKNIRR